MTTTVTEKDLERQSSTVRKDEQRWRKSYDTQVDMIRRANLDGLSYDRIAKSTGLSKTQVQRICGTE